MPISKATNSVDYVNIKRNVPVYVFTRINDRVNYLRLGDFSASTKTLAESNLFYNRIKDSLNTANLIVDLRNNGGGGFKNSKKFLKLLQKYKGNKYVLINNRTFSNAEEFVVELQKEKNVLTLGQQTNGTLTYGSNYGKHTPIGEGRYRIYMTDMKDKGGYLTYEEVGIAPQVLLENDADWIEKVVSLIEDKK